MIEIRPYDGGTAEVSEFTTRVWSNTYSDIPVLGWTESYFDWQLLSTDSPDFLVAAYDGTKLIGTLFAEPFSFSHKGAPLTATMASWLTVDPDYRGHGLATRLADAQREVHMAHDAMFCMGFGILGTHGLKFWTKQSDTRVLGKVGFWVRLFDAKAVANWTSSTRDRMLTRFLGPLRSKKPKPDSDAGIRDYQPADLARCLELAHAMEPSFDLGYRWTDKRLAHQLDYKGVPQTIVAERDGVIEGYINYYFLDMIDRGTLKIAVIDLPVFGNLDADAQKNLMNAALARMQDGGAKLATMLRLSCYPSGPLWATGFSPLPKETSIICALCNPAFEPNGVQDLHVHWR